MVLLTALGIATSLAGSTMSFSQASKQRKLQKEAESKAANAMQEARKRLEKNFFKTLGINKEPYELEREALLSAGSQLISAGTESERGAGAVAGRVLQMQNIGQRNIASAMGEDLLGLNKLVASEDSRLRDANVDLDLGTVAGAQLAARNNEMMANNNIKQGFQGLTNAVDLGLDYMKLYPNTKTPVTPQTVTPQTLTSAPDEQANFTGPMSGFTNETEYFNQAATGTLDPKYIVNGQPMPYAQALQMNQPVTMQSHDWYKTLFPQTFAAFPH